MADTNELRWGGSEKSGGSSEKPVKINSEAYVAVSQVKTVGKSFQEEGRSVYVDQNQLGVRYIPRSQRKKSRRM